MVTAFTRALPDLVPFLSCGGPRPLPSSTAHAGMQALKEATRRRQSGIKKRAKRPL